ncbi:hypothetical protein [Haloterrigena sp. H1]|uniref:hypothetical protein n=1 Tax=Haloterrigena sp. H1 TaxID=2552943 RepID=UPI001BB20E41|nr:hypothetical protein [Haloterrigena sp. H1]
MKEKRKDHIKPSENDIIVMKFPVHYTLSNLKKAVHDPTLFLVEGRRLALSANAAYSRLRGFNGTCEVIDEDWDNLIILDGCRYDLFEEVNFLDGRLGSRTSVGSESWEFLCENFQGRQLHDVIYVTANPHAPKLDDNTFYRTVNLLKHQWDEDLRTVTPEAMTKEALKVHEKHPNKRLIVHYMQPHFPFIGEKGQKITHAGVTPGNKTSNEQTPHVWSGLRDRKLDIDEDFVYAAYRENLELTLPHVRELVSSLDGKSVVTSDHGNLTGDRTRPIPVKGYGHPRGFYAPELVTVPWLVIEGSNRRHITTNPPYKNEQMDSEVVENRLEDLGYR